MTYVEQSIKDLLDSNARGVYGPPLLIGYEPGQWSTVRDFIEDDISQHDLSSPRQIGKATVCDLITDKKGIQALINYEDIVGVEADGYMEEL